jgi:hypothetical protein
LRPPAALQGAQTARPGPPRNAPVHGKELLGDTREGKRTLMLIHLLASAAPDEREAVVAFLALQPHLSEVGFPRQLGWLAAQQSQVGGTVLKATEAPADIEQMRAWAASWTPCTPGSRQGSLGLSHIGRC